MLLSDSREETVLSAVEMCLGTLVGCTVICDAVCNKASRAASWLSLHPALCWTLFMRPALLDSSSVNPLDCIA